jgi:hypothetical protein
MIIPAIDSNAVRPVGSGASKPILCTRIGVVNGKIHLTIFQQCGILSMMSNTNPVLDRSIRLEIAGTLRTASSLGCNGASVLIFVAAGYPKGYTDPDGKWVINNVAAGQNKTREFASQPMNSMSSAKNYFGGFFGVFVFNPESSGDFPEQLSPFGVPVLFSIVLENGLNDFVNESAYYNNDDNAFTRGTFTASPVIMDNGNYEIKVTITIRDGHSLPRSRTGIVAFAGGNEISTDGRIDQAKVNRIAFEALEYAYNSNAND